MTRPAKINVQALLPYLALCGVHSIVSFRKILRVARTNIADDQSWIRWRMQVLTPLLIFIQTLSKHVQDEQNPVLESF